MRVRLLVLALLALLAAATAASAHLPAFAADPVWSEAQGQTVTLSHAYGHPYIAEWLACPRPDRIVVHEPHGGQVDVTDSLEAFDPPAQRKWRATFTPTQAGDHVAELRCRTRVGQTRFDDVIKVVVHAGGPPRAWGRAIGAPLEIVPLTRPYAFPKGSSLRVRVLWQGKPLAGAVLGLEPMHDAPPKEKVPSEMHMVRQEQTNELGEVTVSLPEDGWWALFANHDGGSVEEEGQTYSRRHRAGLWVRVGW